MRRHRAKDIELIMVCAALYFGGKSEGAVCIPEDGFLRPVTT